MKILKTLLPVALAFGGLGLTACDSGDTDKDTEETSADDTEETSGDDTEDTEDTDDTNA